MAMAAAQNPAPSFLNFLEEGFLLPNRNRRLFVAVCAVMIASTSLLLLPNQLVLRPLADEISLDVKALNTTAPGTPEYAELVKEIKDDSKELMLAGLAYLLFAVVLGSATRIVVLFAAVGTYSGEQHTFGALLGRVKAQLKGPLLTLAFVYVLEIAYIVLVEAMVVVVVLLGFLMVNPYFLLFLVGALLVVPAFIFYVYFSFVCSVSVVVAVAEPGCHGAGAFGRAWRLVKGKKWQVVVYIAVTFALTIAVWLVYTLAKLCAPNSLAAGLLLKLVFVTLTAVVGLFAVCAMTAFYYERREQSNQLAATGYVKISTEEANA